MKCTAFCEYRLEIFYFILFLPVGAFALPKEHEKKV
jgi:hypothetical protein